jgi:AraC-like DNA-binding protein
MPLLTIPPLSKRKELFILIVGPILAFTIAFLLLQKPTINFLSPEYRYQVYSDKETGQGKSEIQSTPSTHGIKIKYTLKPGDPYPFVFVAFTSKNYEPFDTDGYILNLNMDGDMDHELSLRVGLVLEGYTKKENLDSYTFVEKSFPIKKGRNHLQIPLNEIIRTPSWWFSNKGFSEYNLPDHSRHKTGYIAIYDVKPEKININRNWEINAFEIHPTYQSFYLYSSIALMIYVILIYLRYKFKTPKSDKILVPIDLSMKERKEKNYPDLILQYLAQNFSNPDLKLEDIAKEIGLSENQISIEIKNYSGKTFKAYLNFLRIEKAKKLLVESELQVAEIAFEVGYNSAHHFIRVFKELEDTSPTNFRKEHVR